MLTLQDGNKEQKILEDLSRNSRLSLDDAGTRKIQEEINDSWISWSVPNVEACGYFIQAGLGGLIKIGKASRAAGYRSRLVALQVGSPIPLRSLVEINYEEEFLFFNYGADALTEYVITGYMEEDRQAKLVNDYSAVAYGRGRELHQILETSLHKRFEEDRVVGEWFFPSFGLLSFILDVRKAKYTEGLTYNVKKASTILCSNCERLTYSSTLRCCGPRSKYEGKSIKGKCKKCFKILLTSYRGARGGGLCGDCYVEYVELVRDFHKRLFV